MTVPSGFGKQGLDYDGCIDGWYFAIETKVPGEWLTPRQRETALDVLNGGGKVFIISGPDGLEAFQSWVGKVRERFDDAKEVLQALRSIAAQEGEDAARLPEAEPRRGRGYLAVEAQAHPSGGGPRRAGQAGDADQDEGNG
jgi:hypothetical protein